MADNLETAFAEEAQEQALLSRTESYQDYRTSTTRDDATENTQLLPQDEVRRRHTYQRAGASYQRAIDEPWTGAHGVGSLPWYKRPSIYWLLPAFFPFCIAFGGMMVPKTYLILDLICRGYLSDREAHDPTFHALPVIFGQADNPQCRDPHVQQRNAWFNIYQNVLTGLFSAIVTPHLGALSDRIGRKKVIIWTSFGGMVAEIITILVGTHAETASVYWLLLGCLADGLSGSFTSGMALAFAYASDCTAPEKRNVAFGYFQGTLFAGIALGPIFAGWLIKYTGTVITVFYAVLVCHVFFITFVTLLVPESLSKERQLVAREKRAQACAKSSYGGILEFLKVYNFYEPLWVLRPTGPGTSSALRKNLIVLAIIDTMMFGVAMGTMQIVLIYAEYRFGWNAVDSSVYISIVGISRVSYLVLLLPLLTWMFRRGVQRSGHKGSDKLDIGIIRSAIVFDFLGYLGYALTPSGPLMILSGVIAAIGGIGSPTLQSSLTKHLPAARTGQVLGAMGFLHALARVVAPLLFNLIYGLTVKIYAGIVFLCLASVFVVVFAISWLLKRDVYFDEDLSIDSSEEEAGQD